MYPYNGLNNKAIKYTLTLKSVLRTSVPIPHPQAATLPIFVTLTYFVMS